VTPTFDIAEMLRRLDAAGVEHILIGGLAVNAYGAIRTTKDVDICPDPDPANLERLAALLRELDVRQLGVEEGGSGTREMPFDPTRPADLARGGNFRLETSLGVLDIMQWVPGINADQAYATLARDANEATAFGVTLRVCSLSALRQMKRATGRPRDLQDLADLEAAHPED
jgi:hypothetical protein